MSKEDLAERFVDELEEDRQERYKRRFNRTLVDMRIRQNDPSKRVSEEEAEVDQNEPSTIHSQHNL